MKKTILFAFAAVMAFASCGNKATQVPEEPAADSLAVVDEVVEAAADSITSALASQIEKADASQVQSTLTMLQEKYAELVKSGKLEEAKKYASAVQQYIADNADKIKEFTAENATVASLVEAVKNLPVGAEASAEEALAAVKTDAKALVDGAKEAAETKAQEKVNEVKDAAAKAVNDKVEEAKAKANDAASKAINDAASKLLGK